LAQAARLHELSTPWNAKGSPEDDEVQ